MDFVITCPDDPHWKLELGNCDEAHARSVLEQLEEDPTARRPLELHGPEGLLRATSGEAANIVRARREELNGG